MQHFLVSESCTGYHKSKSAHFIEEIAPHPTLLGEEKPIPRSQNSFIFDYFDKVFKDLKDFKDFKDFRDLIHLQRYFFLSKVRHLFTVSRVT